MACDDSVISVNNDRIEETKPADASSNFADLPLCVRSGILAIFYQGAYEQVNNN
jgi:hypothetical protein